MTTRSAPRTRCASGPTRAASKSLLGADRLVVTGVLSIAFFGLFTLGAALHPSFPAMLQDRTVTKAMFASMLGALITDVTLVVTISQLIVSRKNEPLGDQRTRMSETMDFRKYTTELVGKPAPADPSAFLRSLVGATQTRASDLRAAVDESDPDLRDEVDEFVDSLTGNAEAVREQLDGARFGTFDVVDASTITGTTPGAANVLWIVGIAFTITVVPFLMLTSYVIRIATTAERALAIGPLILRDSQR